ncbi:hypothetical protein [Streptomyces atratus]|nr:hypothetical protein [Streptomyces atratus]MCX5342134.1 hypothetical protein [Streptomyces atratus]
MPESSVRSLGGVQFALMSGVMIQHFGDPATAPSAAEVLQGLRSLAGLAR